MITILDRDLQTGGRASGFDFLRLVLAILVIVIHSVITSYGLKANEDLYNGALGPLVRMVVPSFFALSGYLVAGSLVRAPSIGIFLALRALRLLPALAVEVIFASCVIGPLFTSLALSDYFSNNLFFRYITNFIWHTTDSLPKVFENNPLPGTVNGSLWTIPFEVVSYGALSALALIGATKNRIILPLACVSLVFGYFLARYLKYEGALPVLATALPGTLQIATFLSGAAIYLYRDTIYWNFGVFCATLCFALVSLSEYVPHGHYAAPFFVAYTVVYIGLTNFPRPRLLERVDYSYGIYVYGYIVQQALVAALPWSREWYINSVLALPISIALAAVSWRFVEGPALGLKRKLLSPRVARSTTSELSRS